MKQLSRGWWALFLLIPYIADAYEWETNGKVRVESRIFSPDTIRDTQDWNGGLFAKVHSNIKWEHFSIVTGLFGRADRTDTARDFVAVDDAYLGARAGTWRFHVGFEVFNWGALEFFNPVDIINSRNFDTDVVDQEKLGEFMIHISTELWTGAALSMFWLPRYETPKIPGIRSRMSFVPRTSGGKDVVLGREIFLERNGVIAKNKFNGEQGGARFTQNVGDFDLSLHAVYHMDRSQPVRLTETATSTATQTTLRLTYFPVFQVGGTLTYVWDSLIFKGEWAVRNFNNPSSSPSGYTPILTGGTISQKNHFIAALGLEYGLSHNNGFGSIFIVEAINIFGPNKTRRQALQIFDRDVIVAYSLAFNDTSDKRLTASIVFDVDSASDHEIIIDANYSQRLSDQWKWRIGVRAIDAPALTVITAGLQSIDRVAFLYTNFTLGF